MDQIKIGKFIAECRKNKKLTQSQLAEKLDITDRAISKWETGKGMPDSSIMLALCDELGITVNELLSGKSIELENYCISAEENLVDLKRKEENHVINNRIISILFSLLSFIAAVVCFICNFAISNKLDWSIISFASIALLWLVVIPIMGLGKKGIVKSLLLFTIFIIPYLYVLTIILNEYRILNIGSIMSIITIVYIWSVFGVFKVLINRKIKATAIAILLSIPLCLVINITLSKMISEPIIDIWDILSISILFLLSILLFVFDYIKRIKNTNIK